MNRIISFGEAVVDMLSTRVAGHSDDVEESFRCIAGGAPANVAVAAARLGAESLFAGKVGDDYFGRFLLRSLKEHGVDTSLTAVSKTGKTALAFVSLDDSGERSFSFYGDNAAHLDIRPDDVPAQALSDRCVFHFGSNTLTTPEARSACADIIDLASDNGALVSFDVNYRPGLWPDPSESSAVVAGFLRRADIVKSSKEEMTALYGDNSVDHTVKSWLAAGVGLVVLTDGPGDIEYFGRNNSGRNNSGRLEPPRIRAVDTTAAGDAFVGGMLATIARDGSKTPRDWLQEPAAVKEALGFAARCGAFSVTRHGAFPSMPTRADLQPH